MCKADVRELCFCCTQNITALYYTLPPMYDDKPCRLFNMSTQYLRRIFIIIVRYHLYAPRGCSKQLFNKHFGHGLCRESRSVVALISNFTIYLYFQANANSRVGKEPWPAHNCRCHTAWVVAGSMERTCSLWMSACSAPFFA